MLATAAARTRTEMPLMRRATTFVCLLACFGCRADGPAAFERCPPAGEAAPPLPVAAKPAPDATRYFVRPDGSDANQCSGRVDAPYQEGGNRDCACFRSEYLYLRFCMACCNRKRSRLCGTSWS